MREGGACVGTIVYGSSMMREVETEEEKSKGESEGKKGAVWRK